MNRWRTQKSDILLRAQHILEWENPPQITRDLYLIWKKGCDPQCCLTGLMALSCIMSSSDGLLEYYRALDRGLTLHEVYTVLEEAGFSQQEISGIESMFMGTEVTALHRNSKDKEYAALGA